MNKMGQWSPFVLSGTEYFLYKDNKNITKNFKTKRQKIYICAYFVLIYLEAGKIKTPVSWDTCWHPIWKSLSPVKCCYTNSMCSLTLRGEPTVQPPDKAVCFSCYTSHTDRRLASSLIEIALKIAVRLHWSVQKRFKTFLVWMPLAGFTTRLSQGDVETTNMAARSPASLSRMEPAV